MFMAIRCTSLEIVADYCLNRTLGAIDYPDFQHPFITGLQSAIPFFWVLKYLPWLTPMVTNPSDWVINRLPSLRHVFEFRHDVQREIDEILDNPSVLEGAEHPTVYQHIMAVAKEKKIKRDLTRDEMFQEALAILLAGSDTVGNSTSVGVFHVLYNEDVLRKLKEELRTIWPDAEVPVSYTELEKLPYLTAVVKESLRLGHGAVSSLPRVVGPEDAVITGIQVPKGTIVSTSVTYVHFDEDIFPDARTFRPERWLEANGKSLDSWLLPFSKGPRMCLGLNLAWSELYLLFGNIFRKLDLELYKTTLEDMSEWSDIFVPVYKSEPLRVNVLGVAA